MLTKFLLPFVCVLAACASAPKATNTNSCKSLNQGHEAKLLNQYTELGKITEKCYWADIESWHVTKEDKAARFYNSCVPMPEIVKVKCFSNCSSGHAGCIIFYEDGHTMLGVD